MVMCTLILQGRNVFADNEKRFRLFFDCLILQIQMDAVHKSALLTMDMGNQ